MNAPTGPRDGAEIGLAPEANGFMEGRGPGPEWEDRREASKSLLVQTPSTPLPALLGGWRAGAAPPGPLPPHTRSRRPIPTTGELSSLSQLVPLLIPRSLSLISVPPSHQAPVKPLLQVPGSPEATLGPFPRTGVGQSGSDGPAPAQALRPNFPEPHIPPSSTWPEAGITRAAVPPTPCFPANSWLIKKYMF